MACQGDAGKMLSYNLQESSGFNSTSRLLPTLPQLLYPIFHPIDQLLLPLADFTDVLQLAKVHSKYGSAETSPSRTLF